MPPSFSIALSLTRFYLWLVNYCQEYIFSTMWHSFIQKYIFTPIPRTHARITKQSWIAHFYFSIFALFFSLHRFSTRTFQQRKLVFCIECTYIVRSTYVKVATKTAGRFCLAFTQLAGSWGSLRVCNNFCPSFPSYPKHGHKWVELKLSARRPIHDKYNGAFSSALF